MLKSNYSTPETIKGFDEPCAFIYEDGDIALDFVNHERRDFASETHDIDLEWPWEEGYSPTPQDWEKIGFSVIKS